LERSGQSFKGKKGLTATRGEFNPLTSATGAPREKAEKWETAQRRGAGRKKSKARTIPRKRATRYVPGRRCWGGKNRRLLKMRGDQQPQRKLKGERYFFVTALSLTYESKVRGTAAGARRGKGGGNELPSFKGTWRQVTEKSWLYLLDDKMGLLQR